MATNFEDNKGNILSNSDGDVILANGATVPADASTGYATGCLFMHTDGGDATALYVNEGTSASANFNAITVAA
jgi:hypothetical protein